MFWRYERIDVCLQDLRFVCDATAGFGLEWVRPALYDRWRDDVYRGMYRLFAPQEFLRAGLSALFDTMIIR